MRPPAGGPPPAAPAAGPPPPLPVRLAPLPVAGPAKLPVHKEGTLVFHELLMSLARRLISLPPDGLGASRFAGQHREMVRQLVERAPCPV